MSIKTISHRGHWLALDEKNKTAAFHRSFSNQFGTETDIRDSHGILVISHDAPTGGEMSFAEFLQLFVTYDERLPLALNVKADGLQDLVLEAFDQVHRPPNCFFFDMSIPDALGYLRRGLPIYTRHSDVEPEPVLYDESVGVWLDSFGPDWVTEAVIERHLRSGKAVCLVSPELHGRDHRPLWEQMRGWPVCRDPGLTLCTDWPIKARGYFS